MCTRGPDEHDRLAWLQRADPMQYLQAQQWPALLGLLHDLLQRFFRHAGRMLEKHAGHILPVIEVPHVADEAGHRADAQVGGMQRVQLRAGIERALLNTNRHAQPPVTVGKKATSSPSITASSRPHSS